MRGHKMCEHEHFSWTDLEKLGYLGMDTNGAVLKMTDVGVCDGMLYLDPRHGEMR